MHIEKVSKYIHVTTPSRSNETHTGRMMLMSIPRIKWLEGAETDFYHTYTEKDVKLPPAYVLRDNRPNSWVEKIIGQDLTERETEALRLLRSGMANKDIAAKIGLSRSGLRDMIIKIKIKKSNLNEAGI